MNTSKQPGHLTDAAYLLKLKNAGLSNTAIAAKLGWSEDQVHAKLMEVLQSSLAFQANGYGNLITAFNDALLHYQALGNKTVPLGMALSNPPSVADVLPCYVEGDAEQTAINFLTRFIVLRPFSLPKVPLPQDAATDPAQN